MQTANGIVILSPEHHQHKTGVTPAEVLLLHKMHFQYSNGSPLKDFFIQKGEAITVDQEGKPAEEAYFNQHTGRNVPAKSAVPAVTHTRTNLEEVARLKKKYTGVIDGKPAFEAVFGSTSALKLPQTFEEIAEQVGIEFHEQPAEGDAVAKREVNQRKDDLLRLSRPDVSAIANSHKIKVHAEDTKETIVVKIIEKEQAAAKEAEDAEAAERGKQAAGN
jgi:hypothetical protein